MKTEKKKSRKPLFLQPLQNNGVSFCRDVHIFFTNFKSLKTHKDYKPSFSCFPLLLLLFTNFVSVCFVFPFISIYLSACPPPSLSLTFSFFFFLSSLFLFGSLTHHIFFYSFHLFILQLDLLPTLFHPSVSVCFVLTSIFCLGFSHLFSRLFLLTQTFLF